MAATEQEAGRFTRYLDTRAAAPEHADLVFVFGTGHSEPARIVADLVKRGIGPTVVLTGGKNRLTGIVDARAHLETILREGILQDCISVEGKSTNALENVVFALPKMERYVEMEKTDPIVVVTKWYHCRRAMMTLRRHLPAGIRYSPATYEPQGIGRADWWQSEEGSRRVMAEKSRIVGYLESEETGAIREDGGAYI